MSKRNKDAAGKRCCYCRRLLLPPSYMNDPDHALRGRVATTEHIIPRAHGGTNEEANLAMADARCNNLRGHLSHEIFSVFARHVLQAYPDAPTIYLRGALQRFVTSLAEIAIRNRKETSRAISHALLTLGDDLKNDGHISNNRFR